LEVWHLDSDFDELLHTGASRYQLEKLSAEKGHSGLTVAALALVQSGETSAEEVERVIGPVEELSHG
jgi:type II secretory ATPase GspE/PulE/Tfp pilus assembly ATPase PilB-like protein